MHPRGRRVKDSFLPRRAKQTSNSEFCFSAGEQVIEIKIIVVKKIKEERKYEIIGDEMTHDETLIQRKLIRRNL